MQADLDCPFVAGSRPEILDWLLSLAIHLEFTEKAQVYTGDAERSQGKAFSNENPLENLDCEFKHVLSFLACFNHQFHF